MVAKSVPVIDAAMSENVEQKESLWAKFKRKARQKLPALLTLTLFITTTFVFQYIFFSSIDRFSSVTSFAAFVAAYVVSGIFQIYAVLFRKEESVLRLFLATAMATAATTACLFGALLMLG